MNKFLAALAVIALCLAITHATSLTNRRLQARGAAFLKAESLGMISQDSKEEKLCRKGCKRTEKRCKRRIKKICKLLTTSKRCGKLEKAYKNWCKASYEGCKDNCKDVGSG